MDIAIPTSIGYWTGLLYRCTHIAVPMVPMVEIITVDRQPDSILSTPASRINAWATTINAAIQQEAL